MSFLQGLTSQPEIGTEFFGLDLLLPGVACLCGSLFRSRIPGRGDSQQNTERNAARPGNHLHQTASNQVTQ
jgi:hypothetical protein